MKRNLKPLSCVCSTTVKLTTAETGQYIATKAGSKAQSYTSWDCASRSFVLSYYYSGIGAGNVRRRRNAEANEEGPPEPDVPTEEEKEEWTDADLDMVEAGKKFFFRDVGLLTRKQLEAEKYLRMIRERCVPSRGKRSVDDLDPTELNVPPESGTLKTKYIDLSHAKCEFVANMYVEPPSRDTRDKH